MEKLVTIREAHNNSASVLLRYAGGALVVSIWILLRLGGLLGSLRSPSISSLSDKRYRTT